VDHVVQSEALMDNKAILEKVEAKIRENIPGFEVRYKDEHFSQKLIGFLLKWVIPFNRAYMTDYTTTVYPRVYFPSRAWAEENPGRAWKILTHEYVHLWDQQQHRIWYPVSYFLPQALLLGALLALGAFWCLWFLLALGSLLFGLPWPSKWRTDAEMRGYGMTMAVNYWRYGSIREDLKTHIAERFLGWDYYRMSASKKRVTERINRIGEALQSGAILIGGPAKPYRDVHGLLEEEGELYSA
jgi:hypothetical protein